MPETVTLVVFPGFGCDRSSACRRTKGRENKALGTVKTQRKAEKGKRKAEKGKRNFRIHQDRAEVDPEGLVEVVRVDLVVKPLRRHSTHELRWAGRA